MTRELWRAAEIAAATGGEAWGDWAVAGVSINSRTVRPGELFIALRGPNHDGHAFVSDALARGAAALVDRVPADLSEQASLVVVDDTMAALTALGRAARHRTGARIAALTGSVGKTGTKEALRLALAAQAPTHASAASHNNHWGVPLSLARAPRDTVYGIYELGMNAPGEIATLARLVRPHVAMITTIEAAHLGFFTSVEAIADAKGEIFQGIEPGGVAVLNADNAHYARLRTLAEAAGCARVIGFGATASAAARLSDARLDTAGSDVVMTLRRARDRVSHRRTRAALGEQCARRDRLHRRAGRGPRDGRAGARGLQSAGRPRPAASPRRAGWSDHFDRRQLQRQPGVGARGVGGAGECDGAQARRARRHA